MVTRIWKIQLTATAQRDYEEILSWTLDHFGVSQAKLYDEILLMALDDLLTGPDLLGVQHRDEIGSGICTLHVARKARKGRHFVMFRISQNKDVLEVLRLLHDQMDLARHLPADDCH